MKFGSHAIWLPNFTTDSKRYQLLSDLPLEATWFHLSMLVCLKDLYSRQFAINLRRINVLVCRVKSLHNSGSELLHMKHFLSNAVRARQKFRFNPAASREAFSSSIGCVIPFRLAALALPRIDVNSELGQTQLHWKFHRKYWEFCVVPGVRTVPKFNISVKWC